MSNVTRLEQVCLEEANGDIRLALTLCARKAVQWYLAMSPGYVRERPSAPWAISPKPPLKDAVLLDSERDAPAS